MMDFRVKADNVAKTFRLPHERSTSLKQAALNLHRRRYENFDALKNINFEVTDGEFFGIVGRNGSGKSTLLKILAGIYQPSKGRVGVNGRLTPFIELGVGFNMDLSGRDNVYLNGAILGLTRKEVEAKYDEIVAFSELSRFMDQKLKNYSSGMQVRLAFSIAIQAHSDILLVDEVLAVGDIGFQEKCYDVFRKIKKESKTVIFVSHDLGAVQRFCNRVMILDNGKQVDIGEARDMVLKYGAIVAEEQYRQEKQAEKERRKLTTTTKHSGRGDVTIEGVEIIDKTGKPTRSIREGQPFTVRASFRSAKQVDDVMYGVSILDENRVSLLGPNTNESKYELGKVGKKGYVDAHFSQNPLSPGSYSITSAFFNKKMNLAYDYVENVAKFKVLGTARHGSFYIEPDWDVKNG